MATDGSEKRQYLRFPVELPVEFGKKDHYLSSICSNLSQEGICVETSQDITIGDRVCLFIYLPNQCDPIKMVGEVMWMRRDESAKRDIDDNEVKGIGIRFINSFPEGEKLLKGTFTQDTNTASNLIFRIDENKMIL